MPELDDDTGGIDLNRLLGAEPTAEPKTDLLSLNPEGAKKTDDKPQAFDLAGFADKYAEVKSAVDNLSGLSGLATALKESNLTSDEIRQALSGVKQAVAQNTGVPTSQARQPASQEQVKALIDNFNKEYISTSPGDAVVKLLEDYTKTILSQVGNSNAPVAVRLAQTEIEKFKNERASDPDNGALFKAGERDFDALARRFTPEQLAAIAPPQLRESLEIMADAAENKARKAATIKAIADGTFTPSRKEAPPLGSRTTSTSKTTPEDPLSQMVIRMGRSMNLPDADIADILAQSA
jgi:hypothetical protein